MTNLWAITSYFNPMRYRRRLLNYRHFRRWLTIPLATVELSFQDGFELQQGDADLLIQLPGQDIMWQKERLLNLALMALPSTCGLRSFFCTARLGRSSRPFTGAISPGAIVSPCALPWPRLDTPLTPTPLPRGGGEG
jgi:hypothetical protein